MFHLRHGDNLEISRSCLYLVKSWEFKIGGNNFIENYYKLIEVRNLKEF